MMDKIVFHPFDIKGHGAHMGLYRKGKVTQMPYDIDDIYGNDQPIKTCRVVAEKWIEETKSYVLLLKDVVVVEDTCEEVGTLCLIIPIDKVADILRPVEDRL